MVRNHSKREPGTKRAYENPKMEIVSFQAADVIVTSVDASNENATSGWTGYY